MTVLSLLLNVTLAAWLVYDHGRASKRAYERALGEVWSEIQPVYESMGLEMSRVGEPSSFAELLRPLVAMPKMPE